MQQLHLPPILNCSFPSVSKDNKYIFKNKKNNNEEKKSIYIFYFNYLIKISGDIPPKHKSKQMHVICMDWLEQLKARDQSFV